MLVVDENNATVAVVEHMRADAEANGNLIVQAPAFADLLRAAVTDYDALDDESSGMDKIEILAWLIETARPLLAAIDGAPAHAESEA